MSIEQLPPKVILAEKQSQRDRVVMQVMQALYDSLHSRPLILEDGAECMTLQFTEPEEKDGRYIYRFDVRFPDKCALDHLEFEVRCCGFGGGV